jgi:F0F1-type ATP synthase assembly protein I
MAGGRAAAWLAVVGVVLTGVGLGGVAVDPPTALSPIGFLGTLALGAGLAVVGVAALAYVAASIVTADAEPAERVGTAGAAEEESDEFIWGDAR